MEFRVLEITENSLKIKIFEADASVMYPVVENLLSDERVLEANYSVEHQELDDPILSMMCVDGADPRTVLAENAEKIKDTFSKVYEELFQKE